jgi:hypothetical protein
VSDEKKSSGGFFAKVFGGIFALMTAIATPLIVKYSDRWFGPAAAPSAAASAQAAVASHDAKDRERGKGHGKGGAGKPEPVKPKGGNHPRAQQVPGSLLTAHLSDHFISYSWNADAKKRVVDPGVTPTLFALADATSALHVPVSESMGALVTKQPHENYRLTLEYSWGEGFAPSSDKVRRAMVLVHAADEPAGLWPPAVACLLNEGDEGSLRLFGEPDRIKAKCKCKEGGPKGQHRDYDPSFFAQPVSSTPVGVSGGTIHRLGFPEKAPAKDPGEVNKLEILCDGNKLTVKLNDKIVNELTDLNVRKGKIALTSEHAEFFVERFQVQPLPKGPGPRK